MKIITNQRVLITIGLLTIALLTGLSLFLYIHLGEEISIPEGMKTTVLVPTLDMPIPRGMNAIWSASFLSAWKTLQLDLVKEPISLEGSPKIVSFLNNADDPRPDIPKEALYATAGWNQEGIINQIQTDWQQRFPNQEPPTFPGILPNAFVMYAYLNAQLKFRLPYFQNNEPLFFFDSYGNYTSVKSFGIREKDELAYFELRGQPALFFPSKSNGCNNSECIIDLDRTSKPNQIVLAVVERKHTLAEIYKSVQEKIGSVKQDDQSNGFDSYDILLVPDILLHINHYLKAIERHNFKNTTLKLKEAQGNIMRQDIQNTTLKLKEAQGNIMRQDIQFHLDRGGTELKLETKEYPMYGTYSKYLATICYFNRPFLLYMKQREAKMPYFVMWVDNAELLQQW